MSILFPDPLPGTRIVNGRPYIFDLDALNAWNAVAAKMDAPDDLSGLSEDELDSLFYRAIRIDAMSHGADPDLMRAVEVETQRRKARAATRGALAESVAQLSGAAS